MEIILNRKNIGGRMRKRSVDSEEGGDETRAVRRQERKKTRR